MEDLTGVRCSLRTWRPQDAPDVAALANDADVARYLPPRFPFPYRLHDAQEWLRKQRDIEPPLNFAILYQGSLAGSVGLIPGADDLGRAGTTAIGYWLGKRFWGKGIATEAVQLLSAHAFAAHGVRRLWANLVAANVASAKVLERAGFHYEATLRGAFVDRDGVVQDELIFVRFRTDALEKARPGGTQPETG